MLLLVTGITVWWSGRDSEEKGSPRYREPQGWEVLDPTPGIDGWARRVQDPRTGVIFILVEPGSFMMGSPEGEGYRDEHPQHKVQITKPFYLAETETTVTQWRRFDAEYGYGHKGCGKSEEHPITEVSWNNAMAFCKHYGYRLPTEAEWEYACRAGSQTTFSFGNEGAKLLDYGWFFRNSGKTLLPEDTKLTQRKLLSGEWGCEARRVGGKKPNALGLYDMHGNVWEWCEEGRRFYTEEPQVDPVGFADPMRRAVRGGSWRDDADACRSAYRNWNGSRNLDDFIGFRPAKSVES